MKRKEQKAQWQELSEHVFEEVLQWREKHPQVTMRESETDSSWIPIRFQMELEMDPETRPET